jgi:DNA-binding NtrC family response regulator
MREVARQVERVLGDDTPVCLSGEGGTGKEVVARAIHASGPRRDGPFVVFNCATVAASSQEPELFGQEQAVFGHGASAPRGRLQEAAGGTLFLDKLAELGRGAQLRLAEALRTGMTRRLGGRAVEVPLDFRIVSATRRDLAAEVEAGRFSQELFELLAERPIRLAPLRERAEDIPLLVAHFTHAAGKEAGCQVNRVSPDALDALARYNWPGNVSELLNVVHRALLACRGDEITLADLPPNIRKLAVPSVRPAPSDEMLGDGSGNGATAVLPLRELERRAIKAALRTTGGSVGKAARLLGIGRATLYRRLADKEFARPSEPPEPKVAGAGGRGEH